MGGGRRGKLHISKLFSFSCNKPSIQDDHSQIGGPGFSRVVFANDPNCLDAAGRIYGDNYVSTTKYTIATFLPKSLFEQFRRVANFYFLVSGLLAFTPLAPYSAVSAIAPLVVVMGATMAKEVVEDWRRFQQGDKDMIKFVGDHNSPRPQLYYDYVSKFFYKVLHPPQISPSQTSEQEKYRDLANLKISARTDESLLYEFITEFRELKTDATSSSVVPSSILNGPIGKSVDELLSETSIHMPMTTETTLDRDIMINKICGNSVQESHLQSYKLTSENTVILDTKAEGMAVAWFRDFFEVCCRDNISHI